MSSQRETTEPGRGQGQWGDGEVILRREGQQHLVINWVQ